MLVIWELRVTQVCELSATSHWSHWECFKIDTCCCLIVVLANLGISFKQKYTKCKIWAELAWIAVLTVSQCVSRRNWRELDKWFKGCAVLILASKQRCDYQFLLRDEVQIALNFDYLPSSSELNETKPGGPEEGWWQGMVMGNELGWLFYLTATLKRHL